MKYQILLFIFSIITFISCNDNRPTTLSGHPFTHHIKNNAYQPKQGDVIQYHFIRRNKSEVLDNTYELGSPKIFKIPNVDPANDKFDRITPLTEAMMQMSEGDSLTLEILFDLLPQNVNDIEEGESIFFDIKLVDVKSKEEIEKEENEIVERGARVSAKIQKLTQQFKKGTLNDLDELDGIRYKIEEKGEGGKLKKGDVVFVQFSGHLQSNGKRYLDSYSKIRPYQFRVGAGRVISAWEKLLPTLSVGDKLYMFVPHQEAYGVAGSPGLGIPEKSDLAIYLEVVRKK